MTINVVSVMTSDLLLLKDQELLARQGPVICDLLLVEEKNELQSVWRSQRCPPEATQILMRTESSVCNSQSVKSVCLASVICFT